MNEKPLYRWIIAIIILSFVPFFSFAREEKLTNSLLFEENISNLKKEAPFPIKEGISIAISLSLIFLILKTNLEKNGRP